MLKKIVPHIAAVFILLGVCIAFFAPQLKDEVIRQGDMSQYEGMANEHRTFERELGEPILWTNALFGGMPTYQITTRRDGNLLVKLENTLRLGFDRPISLFFIAMLSFYLMMLSLGVNPWLGIIGAIAFGFTTNNFVLYEAGHVTKIRAVAYLPLIVAGMVNAFNRKYLLGGVLFALGLGLNICANHIQMTYYFFLTLIIYGVARLIYDFQNKELLHFAKASGVLIVAGLIAIGSSAVNLLPSYEYGQETMRGEPILEKEASAQTTPQGIESSSATDGLSWSYAMNWSNGTLDLFSTLIPRVVGGSSGEKVGKDSELYQALQRRGANLPEKFPAPLYWGALPGTSGPNYFGAIFVFLFIFGLLTVEGPTKWWLGLGTLLTLLLSMGSNFETFNRLLFDNLPLFNKFRSPNSVLSVTVTLIPLLGMLAVSQLQKEKLHQKDIFTKLYIAAGITGAIALFFALIAPSMFSFEGANDAYYEQSGYDVKALRADRINFMRQDAFRSFALVLIVAGLLWAYLKGYFKFNILLIGLGILTFFDLWSIGRRYIDTDDFNPKRTVSNDFQPRAVDQQIFDVEKSRGSYRVLDITGRDPWSDASASYHHNTVNGYNAAKLQRAQDIIDRHLNLGGNINQEVLKMLNTKYIITGQGGEPQLIRGEGLGNAWFVDTIVLVENANAEINALSDFQAARQAIVHQEFSGYTAGFDPSPNGTITLDLDQYRPDHLIYDSNTSSEQLAVFSEVWYNPEKGWTAYIDGEPAEFIRANYILRAMKVPAGQHKIEFIFEPHSFYTGKTISLICSVLILLGGVGFIGLTLPKWIQENKVAAEEQSTSPEPATKPTPKPQPTARKKATPKKSNTKPKPSTKRKKKR